MSELRCGAATLDTESVFEGISMPHADLGLPSQDDLFNFGLIDSASSSLTPLTQFQAVKAEPMDLFNFCPDPVLTTHHATPSSPSPSSPVLEQRPRGGASSSSSADEQLCYGMPVSSGMPMLRDTVDEEQDALDEGEAAFSTVLSSTDMSTSPPIWTPVHLPLLNVKVEEPELSHQPQFPHGSSSARTTRRTRSCSPSTQDEQPNSVQNAKRKRGSAPSCADARARTASRGNTDSAPPPAPLRRYSPDPTQHCRVTLTRSDLLTVTSEEFELFVSTANEQSELTAAEAREVKRQRRLVKNRESALASRTRRKAEMDQLREQVDLLEDQKYALQMRVKELENQNMQFKAEVFQLHQLLAEARGGVGSLVSAFTSVGSRARHNPAAGMALMLVLFSFTLLIQDPSSYLLGASLSSGASQMPVISEAVSAEQAAQLAAASAPQLDLFRRATSSRQAPSGRSLMSAECLESVANPDSTRSGSLHQVAQPVPVVLLDEVQGNVTAPAPQVVQQSGCRQLHFDCSVAA
eukprot:CAMPEP_0177648408 /NCGR_PEP_ID=MMETSP0447-20121125/10810_1 /TAXON_ID=0 /ORGANISM="Stygamoeba regulata, Strain BSH-02190019" /LENGTH=521 /DNA_ID=CAMNT_0019151043 /DNA_START=204 /DNA_END=1769 /DNA_ORIENTATION=-